MRLNAWCEAAQRAMIDKYGVAGGKTKRLAEEVGMTVQYTSSVIHGRQISPKAMQKISDVLGIPYDTSGYETSISE